MLNLGGFNPGVEPPELPCPVPARHGNGRDIFRVPILPMRSLPLAVSLLGVAHSAALAAQSAAPAPVLRGAVELSIGSEDDDRYLFANVSGITVDRSGRIVVADIGQESVRVFDASGRFLFNIGGSGSGPGEYVDGCCPRFGPSGDLWIRDMGNARHVRFAVDATRARERGVLRMSGSNVGFRGDVALPSDSTIIDVVPRREPNQVALAFDLQVMTLDGRVVQTTHTRTPPADSLEMRLVELKQGNSQVIRYFYPPYPPTALFALAQNGEFALGISSQYSISWHAPDGTIRHLIRRDGIDRPALSAGEREKAQQDVKRVATVSGGKARFDVPSRKQPVRSIQFDATGRLWIERSLPEGAQREADVYDRSGRLAEVRRWPSNVSFSGGYLGADVAVGARTDSLGAQQVVRVRFTRQPPR